MTGGLLPVALFALAGILAGGVFSLRRQGAPVGLLLVLVVLAAMSVAAGVLRLTYGGD